jgi:hypothetical protein
MTGKTTPAARPQLRAVRQQRLGAGSVQRLRPVEDVAELACAGYAGVSALHPIPGRAVGASAPPKAGGVAVWSGLMEQMFESGHKSE